MFELSAARLQPSGGQSPVFDLPAPATKTPAPAKKKPRAPIDNLQLPPRNSAWSQSYTYYAPTSQPDAGLQKFNGNKLNKVCLYTRLLRYSENTEYRYRKKISIISIFRYFSPSFLSANAIDISIFFAIFVTFFRHFCQFLSGKCDRYFSILSS